MRCIELLNDFKFARRKANWVIAEVATIVVNVCHRSGHSDETERLEELLEQFKAAGVYDRTDREAAKKPAIVRDLKGELRVVQMILKLDRSNDAALALDVYKKTLRGKYNDGQTSFVGHVMAFLAGIEQLSLSDEARSHLDSMGELVKRYEAVSHASNMRREKIKSVCPASVLRGELMDEISAVCASLVHIDRHTDSNLSEKAHLAIRRFRQDLKLNAKLGSRDSEFGAK